MSDEKALTTVSPYAIMPVMDIKNAVDRRRAIIQFTSTIMVEGQHFGKVPGTDKNTLLKPGAEMLTTFFGLSPRFEVVRETLDWTGAQHNGEAFFYFQYRCQLWRGELLVGEGLGSCNSWEKKYRYRSAGAACPSCNAAAIARSSYPPRGAPEGTPNGWYCKECKANFAHDDPRVANQGAGQVANPNPADLVNTIDKMAQKRALVAATLIAVNASEFFTQDLEDLEDWSEGAIPGELATKPAQPAQSPKPARQQPPAQSTNGTHAVTHWIDSPDIRKRFWTWTRDNLGLEDDDVHIALSVEHVSDYPGTMQDAKTVIEAWVADQAKAEQVAAQ